MGRLVQTMLEPAGPQAARVAHLWWLFFVVTAIVSLLVLAVAAAAAVRGWRAGRVAGGGDPLQVAEEPGLERAVGAAAVATVVVLFVLLVASIATGRALAAFGTGQAVTIDVTGHQWWWELDYRSGDAHLQIKTANEIHIPIGRPVVLTVSSQDVIHSFWAPNLTGKRDLIPGYTTALWLQADRAGVYRGQCAEFCGPQHAHMAFEVVAESDAAFASWEMGQRQPAHAPTTDEERRGRDVFLSAQCALCHTVRGTEANGQVGPDLTHLASRRTIAAGTLANARGQLAGWIVDPQHIKPGTRMPPNPVAPDDLQALVAWLQSLR